MLIITLPMTDENPAIAPESPNVRVKGMKLYY